MEELVRVDEGYADLHLARLYDAECPWHAQDDFYLELDLRAGSVVDVGCGTGTRLARAREVGHPGVLVGVDPAAGMLAVARTKTDRVQWTVGDAQTMSLGRRFELVTMTGHAFQVLLDDDAVLAALCAFRRHVSADGLLAFETRNPAARAWESWVAEVTRSEIRAPDGERYEVWVDDPRTHGQDLVTFTSGTRSLLTGQSWTSTSTLRFIDPDRLRSAVERAGFGIEGWFGDWDGATVSPTSPEIIVLARPDANHARRPGSSRAQRPG